VTWRRRNGSPDAAAAEAAVGAVDQETGEILGAPGGAPDGDARAAGDADGRGVEGERTIPSVNRERSIQSRISTALALGTVVLLGAGFLFWYYNTQFARTRDAEESARKAAAARAAGEMKLPPLGRIDPPSPATPATPAAAPAPATPAVPAANAETSRPASKSPEQLALERRLGAPVLRRAPAASSTVAGAAGGPAAFQPLSLAMAGMPPSAGAPQAPSAAADGAGALADRLAPTPTPAVAARMLPTRRLLLPKGAFIDCTLETAINSSYAGMTTCIGASDVYGADGRVVLLERGTKYVGEQRGEPRQGQGRVFVLWNEARTPAGVAVQLASPGTDELGRSGLPGFVDTHFWQRFGAAILVSVIDGAMQAAASRQRSGPQVGGGGVVLNPQGGRDVMAEVLRNTASIPPTVIKNHGERIQILVARDVDFRSVYALRTDGAGR
jgi:type IV secretion system protein VirB10